MRKLGEGSFLRWQQMLYSLAIAVDLVPRRIYSLETVATVSSDGRTNEVRGA